MSFATPVLNYLNSVPLLDAGFRPFFVGAVVFAITSMGIWAFVYSFGFYFDAGSLTLFQWHAHEMIYGYCLSVIAGFLLTAVGNWTGKTTCKGLPLLILFSLWAAARVLFSTGSQGFVVASILDLIFLFQLSYFIVRPIVQTKQWSRFAVLSKLLLLLVFKAVFLVGLLEYIDGGMHIAIYAGFYLVIGLVLTFGRKVIPFFVEGDMEYSVQIRNSRILDLTSLFGFLIFFVLDLTGINQQLAGYTAILISIVNLLRLYGWYTKGIWQRPLLWGLFVSYLFICLGFLMFAWAYLFGGNKFIAIHALALGGIGVITMSMMARVILGHTGRNIANPPAGLHRALLLVVFGAVTRVLMPLVIPEYYLIWVALSQLAWILGFGLFLWLYVGMLFGPRIDTKRLV